MKNATLCVVMLAMIGCSHSPGKAAASAAKGEARAYYPLKVGNEWTYEVKRGSRRAPLTVSIVDEKQGAFVDSQGARLRFDDEGLRDDTRYLLREPIEVGRQWTNVVSATAAEHYRIVSVGKPCSAPAGNFERCVEVESRNRIDANATLVNHLTFAPQVGIVRIRVTEERANRAVVHAELDLVSYTRPHATRR